MTIYSKQQQHHISEVLSDLADLGIDVWLDLATSFTCTEADAVQRLVATLHGIDAGRVFLDAHTQSDDEPHTKDTA